MDEPAVFETVVDELSTRGWEFLVHVPGSHYEAYQDVLQRANSHSIAISGRFPDVIGLTSRGQVFAVEVKGSSDLLKGVGQTLTYQRGSHLSYLAAPQRDLNSVEDVLLSHGAGTIGTASGGVVSWNEPATEADAAQVSDVESRVKYQFSHPGSNSVVSTLYLTQPLNAYAPVLALSAPTSQSELQSTIVEEFDTADSTTRYAIKGASLCGFLSQSGDGIYSLSEYGTLAKSTLRGEGIETLGELAGQKKKINYSPLVDELPSLAVLLRTAYQRHPDFRQFVEAVSQQNEEFLFTDLLRTVVEQYPNVFLNLFVTDTEKARELLGNNRRNEIYDTDRWKSLVRSNILFNFARQLVHLGILDDRTSSYSGKKSEFSPEDNPWVQRL
ncbi:hypothetical protein [Salinigranum sp. GCM10025319]|uniref:hypothetical protein n=1 Tax=Salinigranum sp. GCM10025319 TaxID=3252687 RepID=UPI003613D36B